MPGAWRPVTWLALLLGTFEILYGSVGVLFHLAGEDASGFLGGLLRLAMGLALCGTGVGARYGRASCRIFLPVAVALRLLFCLWLVSWGVRTLPGVPGPAWYAWYAVEGGLALGVALYFARPAARRHLARTAGDDASYGELLARLSAEAPPAASGPRWVSPVMAILFFITIAWRNDPGFVLPTVLAMVLHELGHIAAFRMYGYHLKAFHFLPFALAVEAEETFRSQREEVVISLFGPLTNALLALASCALYLGTGREGFRAFTVVNATLGFLNILPITPLDGGRVLRGIAYSLPRAMQWLCLVLSAALLLGLVALLRDVVLLILVFPFLSEVKLMRCYGKVGGLDLMPQQPGEVSSEHVEKVYQWVAEEFKPRHPSVLHAWAAAMFKMRFAPRLRAFEIVAALGLALVGVLFHVAAPCIAYKSEIQQGFEKASSQPPAKP